MERLKLECDAYREFKRQLSHGAGRQMIDEAELNEKRRRFSKFVGVDIDSLELLLAISVNKQNSQEDFEKKLKPINQAFQEAFDAF